MARASQRRTPESNRPANLPVAAAALWDWMEKRHFNQREAAKYLNIPWTTLHHYLHNYRTPGLKRANQLFELIGIPQRSWQPIRVGKPKRRASGQTQKRQYLQGGNVDAR